MTAQILQMPDTTEKRMCRSMAALGLVAVDIAGYSAYVYQRESGMSHSDLKLMGFMSWNDARIDAVEECYQQDLRIKRAKK